MLRNIISPIKAEGMTLRKSFWLLTGTPVSESCISLIKLSICKKQQNRLTLYACKQNM